MSVVTTHPPTQPDVIDVALHYAAVHRWRVIPIAPGKKHPPVPEWQAAATTDPAIIRSWWSGLYRGHGVGIATGPGSGIWVLDIDTAGAKAGAESLAELEASYHPLPATVEAVTGTGGRHLFFTWDPDHPVRNNQSGRVGAGIDVRGDGGQVVAAPTIHPTGAPYRWRPGHGPDDIAVAAAPTWLHTLLELEPTPPPAPPRSRALGVVSDDEDSPAAVFNASTTWEQLLTRDGWTLARTLGSGEQRWTRPGKTPRDGVSATVGHAGRDVLKVFTSSVPELEADRAYSRFGYEAAVRHHGDRSALAAQLRRAMNDEARAELTDMSWLADAITTPALPPASDTPAARPAEGGAVEEWPEPEPLEPELHHGPPFPVDVLPAWMGDMVHEVAEALLVPVDLPAVAALGALSTVAMTKVTAHVTGSTWTEDTNLYLMCAFPSGGGKSPAFAAVMRPVEAFEEARIREVQPLIDEATIRLEIASKKAKDAREGAARGSMAAEDAVTAQAAVADIVVPPSPAFIAEDATPEALGQHLDECGGRGAVLSAEGDMVDMMGGQYAEKGKGANLGVYLKSYSGESLRVKRVGRGVIRLPKSTLTICVMPQPVLVRRLGENAELGERGITARFLYSVPPTNIGGRNYEALLRPAGAAIRQAYEDRLLEIAGRLTRFAYPMALRTSKAATTAWIAWLNATEARLRPGADLEGMAGWVAKLRGQTLRIAALLHLADGRDQNDELDVATLERAFVLADYWIAHYKACHAVWTVGANPVLQRARRIVEWALREGVDEFSASDLQKRMRRVFESVEDTVKPLTWLVEAGWLRAHSGLPVRVGQRGTSSPRFELRPDAEECANGAKPVERDAANGAKPVDDYGGFAPFAHSRTDPSVSEGGVDAHSLLTRFSDLSIYILNSGAPSDVDEGARECANGANGTNGANDALPADDTPPIVADVEAPSDDVAKTPAPTADDDGRLW